MTENTAARRRGNILSFALIVSMIIMILAIGTAYVIYQRETIAQRLQVLITGQAPKITVAAAPSAVAATPVVARTEVSPTATLIEPTKGAPDEFVFIMNQNLRNQNNVEIYNDRPEWDGRANGLVSALQVMKGEVLVTFQLWGPAGKWTHVIEEHERRFTEADGFVNLQEEFYPCTNPPIQLNDTVQAVVLLPGSRARLFENDEPGNPGVIVALDP